MRKNILHLIVGFTVLLSFFVAISCATVKQDEPEAPGMTHNEMLQELGIVTNLGELKDPEGNPLPEDYNPLGKKCGVFSPVKEIYFAGYYYYAGRSQYLIDDYKAGLGGLYTSGTDDSWVESQYKNCIGADVDGDGFDEVVVVYYASNTLYLKVIDNDNGTYGEYNKAIITGITGDLPAIPQYQPALAKGDLDGDGKDELILGFSYWAWILDDKDSDYAVTSKNYPNSRDLYIAAGDIDGDSQDEFIITYYYSNNAYCDIFDGDFSTPFITRYNYHLFVALYGFTFEQRVHVVMGDIDGDRLDEIVFHGESSVGNEHWSLLAMDDAKHGFAWLDFFTYTWQDNNVAYIFGGYTYSPALAILDYNGDGLDDIFASDAVYDYKIGSCASARLRC